MDKTSMERTSDREVVIARDFDAPPRVVFDAWTRPELVRQWWAPKSHGLAVAGCEAEVRVGGRYRYLLQPERGNAQVWFGRYTEVTPATRLVYTQAFETQKEAEVVVTVTFEEREGHTHLVAHEFFPSRLALETSLAEGLEHGIRESLDQLAGVLASLADEQRQPQTV
jgi:uncharacterized protein YndB with AHSA1/START domain